MLTVIAVAGAGALGAPARLLVDQSVSRRHGGAFPLGTFVINVTGSILLGLITGLAVYQHLGDLPKTIVGTGFCGAYTTFSTFSYETIKLAEEGAIGTAVRYAASSLAIGLVAAGVGLAIAWVV